MGPPGTARSRAAPIVISSGLPQWARPSTHYINSKNKGIPPGKLGGKFHYLGVKVAIFCAISSKAAALCMLAEVL
jgi:hypothetical protein